MVNSVENTLVQNRSLNVGILNPPQDLYKPELYNDKKASAQFKQLSADIYQKEKSKSFENTKKTPLSVFVALLLTAAAGGWIVFKKALKW